MKRYFLSQDSSSHWYIVEYLRRAEWFEWVELDEDDERAWQEPSFAQPIACDPGCVTFTYPVIEYGRSVDK